MSTYFPSGKDLAGKRKWYVVDARKKTLGRLCTEIATVLMGKKKPEWTPFLDTGDHVIVINAKHVNLKGEKAKHKEYYRHSGYPGGLKTIAYERMLEKNPERVVQMAVQRMLPKSKLGRAMFRKLNVYSGAEHPHAAQKPEPLEIETI